MYFDPPNLKTCLPARTRDMVKPPRSFTERQPQRKHLF